MRHRRSAVGLTTFAVIVAMFLMCPGTASAGIGDTHTEALNGTGEYAWWSHYMNTSWNIQMKAHDPDGIQAIESLWDGAGSWTELVNDPGGASDVYRYRLITVNRTTHSADGRHKLTVRSRGYWWFLVTYVQDGWEDPAHDYYVYIDSNPPTNSETHTTPDGSGNLVRWYHGPVSFAFSATDPTASGNWHSGVSWTMVYLDDAVVLSTVWGAHPDTASVNYTVQAPTSGANDGIHKVEFTSEDWSWPADRRTITKTTRTVKIDRTPPSASQTGADAAWHREPVPLVFNAADPSSGVRLIQWAIDGAAPTSQTYQVGANPWGPATATATYTFPAPADHSGDGVHDIVYRALDWSYPHGTATSVDHTCQVKIDTVGPVTTQAGGNSGPHNTPVTVSFSAYDPNPPNCSGVDRTMYQVDGGGWLEGTSVTIPAPPQTSVTHTIEYRSVDKAGNTENINSCQVEIVTDITAPVTTVSGADDTWHNTPVTLTFSASDPPPNSSGIAYTEWQIDSGSWTQSGTCTVPAPADHSGDAVHIVSYRSMDNDGNIEAVKTCQVKIDTTGPTTTALNKVTVKKGNTATFRFTFTDLNPSAVALSPTATVKIVITKGGVIKKILRVGTRNAGVTLTYKWKCGLKVGTYSWSVRATDLAGNPEAVKNTKSFKVK